MESYELLQRQNRMLKYLSGLPKRMLLLHGVDNITEFVLHDLCHEQCFNFKKVAYFVDNPDFNCTKGVAGYSKEEAFTNIETPWDDPRTFSALMQLSPFNQHVRSLNRCSVRKGKETHEELAHVLAQDLGFKNHAYTSWQMKHDNEGFVLYEKNDKLDTFAQEHLIDGLTLLSFCPIF